MAESSAHGPSSTAAQPPIPESVMRSLQQGPAAMWSLDRKGGAVLWANEAAHVTSGMQPPLAVPSCEEWAARASPAMGWEPWVALCREALDVKSATTFSRGWPRLMQGRSELWLLTAQVHDDAVLVMAVHADAAASHSAVPWATNSLQRDLLVREVHHRLKNNLQGVSGLLNRQASLHPEAARWLEAAASQLQAMAQVYGLQTQAGTAPSLIGLVRSLAQSVASVFGVAIEVQEVAPHDAAHKSSSTATSTSTAGLPFAAPLASHAESVDSRASRRILWSHLELPPDADTTEHVPAAVHSDQAGALALVINELLTNAVKHRSMTTGAAVLPHGADVWCSVSSGASSAEVQIVNAGVWPTDMNWDQLPPGVHGLGLAKALLPSRGARLQVSTQSDFVCARLHIGPPVWCPLVQSP